MELRNKKWTEEEFLNVRKEVLASWPTGNSELLNLDVAVENLKKLPDSKNFALKLIEAKKSGKTLVQPRAGVADLDKHIELLQFLEAAGADFLPSTIDSYTRQNRYQEAENGIEEDKLDSLVTELVYYIKNEIGTMSIVNLLETRGIVFKEDSELSSKLISAVAEVYNNTPIWTLKGLTAIELENRRSTTIVKEKQPGRNDPCPCGSGKKYKKCCGK